MDIGITMLLFILVALISYVVGVHDGEVKKHKEIFREIDKQIKPLLNESIEKFDG